MARMLIQCDFDGTIIRSNLGVLFRQTFAHGDWKSIESAYAQHRITVEECNRQQYRLITEPIKNLQDFALQHAEVRSGFREFVDYCQQNGIPLVIVSNGADFYIRTILTRIGMSHLELHCGHGTLSGDGIIISYEDPEGNLLDSGFKSRYLQWLRQRDDTIVYLGDGYSDIESASQADHVLATGALPDMLRAESISATPFDNFHEIVREIQSLS
jgi:2-hydroxy-3-keto-5-methylthiopentenyl-1-phosphate phosphatase